MIAQAENDEIEDRANRARDRMEDQSYGSCRLTARSISGAATSANHHFRAGMLCHRERDEAAALKCLKKATKRAVVKQSPPTDCVFYGAEIWASRKPNGG